MFINSPSNYHITMFHTSGLFDPVTNPFKSDRGVNENGPPYMRQRSSDTVLADEIHTIETIASQIRAPVLE
eukprot:scaffold12494_cov42-Prasinocladus_malaysianus.AAC.2